jgi:hypothetical protein
LKQLSEGYCINLSVEFIAQHALLVDAGADLLINDQGGRVAHRLFHIRVLPHFGSPFGLPDILHADALKAVECYGGLKGPLVLNTW